MDAITLGSFLFFTALVGVLTWLFTRRDDWRSEVLQVVLSIPLTALSVSVCPAVDTVEIKVLTFNILQGGNSASAVGSTSPLFQQPRYDDIVGVILQSQADIVGIQEDNGGTAILSRLQADDPVWNRRGAIYSKFPVQPVSAGNSNTAVSRVLVNADQSVVVHNAHWWPGQGYGPFVAQSRLISTGSVTESYVLANSGVNGTPGRNPQESLAVVQTFLNAREPVFVIGDFNEPSHLDWTQNYADNGGADRMTSNPMGTPLNLKVEWRGSKLLADAGLRDGYRTIFPDEIAKPGNTWTPPYANGTAGRRNYDNDLVVGGQVLDRIDRVEFAGVGVTPITAAVVGENPNTAEHGGKSEIIPEIIYNGPWPSDHRAVMVTFEIPVSSFQFGDLNLDDTIDQGDWRLLRDNHLTDMSGLSLDETYPLGDLDGDRDNDEYDFGLFKSVFDEANGTGAFAAMLVRVPEPSPLMMAVCGAVLLGVLAPRTRRGPG